jgi:hypothetical protein
VDRLAKKSEISDKTLERARKTLGAVAFKPKAHFEGGWWMRLPGQREDEDNESDDGLGGDRETPSGREATQNSADGGDRDRDGEDRSADAAPTPLTKSASRGDDGDHASLSLTEALSKSAKTANCAGGRDVSAAAYAVTKGVAGNVTPRAMLNPNGYKDCDGVTAQSPGYNRVNHNREPSQMDASQSARPSKPDGQADKDWIEAFLDFPVGTLPVLRGDARSRAS